MKLFIVGASGLVGSKLLKLGNEEFDVIGTHFNNPLNAEKYNTIRLDATNRDEVFSQIEKYRPDVVINTINIPSVDFCEENKVEARRIIVESNQNILDACGDEAKIVFLSSDYIFDGANGPYSEEDIPNPTSYYGKLKVEAEKMTLNSSPENLIVRTTVLYGWHNVGRPNFALWAFNQLKNGNQVFVVIDQYGTPTLANHLTEIIFELIKREKSGIYNVVGKDFVNRLDFLMKLAEVFQLDAGLIIPVTSDQLKQKTIRGKKLGLKTDKIERELHIKPLGIDEGLSVMKEEMIKNE